MTGTKRQKRTILIVGIIASLLFLLYTCGVFEKTGFVFRECDGGVTLVAYSQNAFDKTTEINIPSQYEGKNVVAIESKAFYKNKKIETVVVPDTVKKLGSAVFEGCENLKSVRLTDSITKMGGACFKDCKSLVEVNLPHDLRELRGETFMGCTSLESLELPPDITEIKGNTFENCEALKSIMIPDGVKRIAAHAFYGCTSLEYVYVPDTVKEIGSSAFRRCYNLDTIELPNGVEINERAFKESPTQVKTKVFTDEMMREIEKEAYSDFNVHVLYSLELGKDEIYCFFENTLVITTSEKFREKHLKGQGTDRKNDIFVIEEHDELLKYLQKAKDAGVTKVVFYAYSQKASDYVGEPYFLINEFSIDDFISSLEPADEE